MATMNGKQPDTTLYPTVTKGFEYDEVMVPPKHELELLGAKVERRAVRYKKGQRVACTTWQDFVSLRDKAETYGGEIQFT